MTGPSEYESVLVFIGVDAGKIPITPLPAQKASLSDTSPGWQCAVLPICPPVKLADEQIAEFSMLCGFDYDLTAQTTQVCNRIRDWSPRFSSDIPHP